MATIKPFQGLRYNPDKIPDISKVVTPPYDVISPEEQDGYYNLHRCNIIRIDKGKDVGGDSESSNKYTRAAEYFDSWISEGILQREAEPAIYVYEQVFDVEGETFSRKGFISNVKLDEFSTGDIYPHEQTLSGPKVDRFKLITECAANFSCIFSLFPDEPSGAESVNELLESCAIAAPDVDFIDDQGVKNMLWVVKDKAFIDKISTLMKDRPLFIADGHHRYETSLKYRNENNGGKEGSESPVDYIMMMCVSMNNSGLKILPTHRAVRNVNGLSADDVKSRIGEMFETRELDSGFSSDSIAVELAKNSAGHSFVLYVGAEKKYYMLTLKEDKLEAAGFDFEYSTWKRFAVGILHGLIFDKLLGIRDVADANEKQIEYVKKESDTITMVDAKGFKFAFFLNPTKITDVQMVAKERQIMPPKSTYFCPKLVTGMVVSKL